MSGEVITLPASAILPTVASLKRRQHIPPEDEGSERLEQLASDAISLFARLAEPVGLIVEATVEKFRELYDARERADVRSVIDDLMPQVSHVALFVATVGERLSYEISTLFSENDFPLASMLDAAASEGADLVADKIERTVDSRWRHEGTITRDEASLRFSPGYCGWDISGQLSLFAQTQPERIGVVLSESCLMSPLKSVSGAILAAPVTAFDIDDAYPFCADCRDRSCRERYLKVMEEADR